jgi:hypothetical protein
VNKTKKTALVISCLAGLTFGGLVQASFAAQEGPSQATATRTLGTVKAVAGNVLTLTSDSGVETQIVVSEGARIVRTEPGQKSLAGATPIQLQDVQAGDRMLVKGTPAGDGKSVSASLVVVMKKTDIAEKHAQEREDWQKRGIGGRVNAIDPAAGTITIATNGTNGNRVVTVHTSKSTIVRRYAANSVKFDDATLARLEDIETGDQLRARGNRNGTDFDAEEIVAGTFRNIAGTVVSIDAAKNEITLMNLATKKPMVVKITADSQIHKLPAMLAEGLAMRAKGGQPQGEGQRWSQGGPPARTPNPTAGGPNGGARPDINQVLNKLPPLSITEMKKGDAVMLVATRGSGEEVTAITLLSGVEPILTAAPKDDGSMILSPWNLSGGEGSGEGAAQ